MSQLDAYIVDPTWGCWTWTGKRGSNGRPIVWRGQKPSAAHRVVYEALVGPIAEGLELDHTCKNPLCVRPAHMDVVDRSTNERRKRFRVRVRIATCKRGHDMAINGMVTPGGGRACRTCSRSSEP